MEHMANPNTNVVFIDTNLDTHLALVVSDLDTVSHLKKKILLEHPFCFPKFGQIQIHGIKVKRKGFFYHLSDSMLVSSAFSGFSKSWFLSVDASPLGDCAQNEQFFSNASPNHVPSHAIANNAHGAMLLLDNKQGDNELIPFPSPCASQHTSKEAVRNSDEKEQIPVVNSGVLEHTAEAVQNLEVNAKSSGNDDPGVPGSGDNCCVTPDLPGSHVECGVVETNKGINNDDSVVYEKGDSKSVPSVKKKQMRKRKKEDAVQDDTSKGNNAAVVEPFNYAVLQDIVAMTNPLGNADKELKENGVLKEHQHTNCNDNNTKNNIDTAALTKEASEPGSSVHKKPKKRKRPMTLDSEEPMKVEIASLNDEAHYKRKESKEWVELNDKSRDVAGYNHNKVTKDTFDTKPPVKKRKGKERSAEKSLSKAKLTNDFLVDNASHHFVEDQQRVKNSSADLSAEPLTTTVQGRRRKEKINSSHPHETPGVTSYGKDEGADRSSIQRGGIQKETPEDALFSKDVSMSKTTIDNMEIGTDASKEGIQSAQKRTGKYKQSDIETKTHPCDVDKPMEPTEDNENGILDHWQKIEADQIEGAEEGREVSAQDDPKLNLLEKSTPSNRHNTDANVRELKVTSKVVDASAMTEPSKSVKAKKGTRKSKNSGGGRPLKEDIGPVDAYESETVIVKSAPNCHPMLGNTDPLNETEGGEIQQEEIQIERAEEGREVSAQDDPKLNLLEKSTPSNRDNTDANARELKVTSKVVDASVMTEPSKSVKAKKGSRKSKNSGGGRPLKEDIGPVDAYESKTVIAKSAPNCDPMLGNTDPLNETEGGEIQQEEMGGAILSPTDKEDDLIADNAGSLEQIEAKSSADHVDKRQRKKSNNKQTSASKSTSNVQTKDPVLNSKKQSPSDSGTHVKPSVDVTKKNKSKSPRSANKSSKTYLEPVKDTDRLEPSDSRSNFGNNDAAQNLTRSPGEKDDSKLEAPSETLKVNGDQQFSSKKRQNETNLSDAVLVGKVNATDRTDVKTVTGKNTHELEATITQTHPDHGVLRIHSDEKLPNVRKTGHDSKLSNRSESSISSIGLKRKAGVNASGKSMDSEKRRELFPKSNSKLEGPKTMVVQNKAGKAFQNSVAVVSKTEQKKSLLAGAIFKDDSSGTSEDEADNSDASTRTPSDNPLLSDFSDEDSSSGSYGGKNLENGGRSSLKASLSVTKGMSIDHILRSSSRFKKAKTTASQFEESESQPEFVPDSLADTQS